jgi:hypothetical protein
MHHGRLRLIAAALAFASIAMVAGGIKAIGLEPLALTPISSALADDDDAPDPPDPPDADEVPSLPAVPAPSAPPGPPVAAAVPGQPLSTSSLSSPPPVVLAPREPAASPALPTHPKRRKNRPTREDLSSGPPESSQPTPASRGARPVHVAAVVEPVVSRIPGSSVIPPPRKVIRRAQSDPSPPSLPGPNRTDDGGGGVDAWLVVAVSWAIAALVAVTLLAYSGFFSRHRHE